MNTNKKAILVVSFGTSYKETREKTIDAIENEIKNSFPDYTIYRAFTSNMIIKKLLKTDNLKIFTVKEALEKLIADNVKELIVQPTHVINGIDNDLMIEKYVEGNDYRVCVVNNNVVAVSLRIPPFIIGDGKNNIKNFL